MIVHILILPDSVVLFHFLPHRLVNTRWRKPKGQSRIRSHRQQHTQETQRRQTTQKLKKDEHHRHV